MFSQKFLFLGSRSVPCTTVGCTALTADNRAFRAIEVPEFFYVGENL